MLIPSAPYLFPSHSFSKYVEYDETLSVLDNYSYFCCCLLSFFSKLTFSKISLRNTNRVSHILDPYQDQHYFGPDLVLNCFQREQAANENDSTNKEGGREKCTPYNEYVPLPKQGNIVSFKCWCFLSDVTYWCF